MGDKPSEYPAIAWKQNGQWRFLEFAPDEPNPCTLNFKNFPAGTVNATSIFIHSHYRWANDSIPKNIRGCLLLTGEFEQTVYYLPRPGNAAVIDTFVIDQTWAHVVNTKLTPFPSIYDWPTLERYGIGVGVIIRPDSVNVYRRTADPEQWKPTNTQSYDRDAWKACVTRSGTTTPGGSE